jgi:RES domain-containing protein
MLTAWRIVKAKYANRAFDGEGARLYGGRWNSVGTPMVYTSQSVSLAVLEMLVHLEDTSVLAAYRLCAVTFDEALLETVGEKMLPPNWRDPLAPPALQHLGDDWVQSRRSAVLRVPSVVVPSEYNYLLNPLHPQFAKLEFGAPLPFEFDSRLL